MKKFQLMDDEDKSLILTHISISVLITFIGLVFMNINPYQPFLNHLEMYTSPGENMGVFHIIFGLIGLIIFGLFLLSIHIIIPLGIYILAKKEAERKWMQYALHPILSTVHYFFVLLLMLMFR